MNFIDIYYKKHLLIIFYIKFQIERYVTMKVNRLFYFLSFLLIFSSLSHAMEDSNKDQNPLEGLQKIVRCAFPPPVYNLSDLNSDINQVFHNAQKFKQDHSIIFMLPNEAMTNILHSMDTRTLLLGLGTTCQFFYAVTQVSALYLNDYCLQETMPHAMPVDILVRKTKNTKDGVLKLANLYSVSAQDLLNWFGQPYLETIIAQKEALPETLKNYTEEEFDALYPFLKVTVATKGLSEPFKTQLPSIIPTTNAIQRLLSVFPSPNDMRSEWDKYSWFVVEVLPSRGLREADGRIIKIILEDQKLNYQDIHSLCSLIDYVVKVDQEVLTSQLKNKFKNAFASCKGSQLKVRMLLCLARLEKEETEKNNLTDQATTLYNEWKNNNGHEFNVSGLNTNGQSGFPAIYFYSDLATVYFYLNQEELCQFHYHNYIDRLLCEDESTQTYILNDLREKGLEIDVIEDMKTFDPFDMIQLNIAASKNMLKKING